VPHGLDEGIDRFPVFTHAPKDQADARMSDCHLRRDGCSLLKLDERRVEIMGREHDLPAFDMPVCLIIAIRVAAL
jgi:hypothetical protein